MFSHFLKFLEMNTEYTKIFKSAIVELSGFAVAMRK